MEAPDKIYVPQHNIEAGNIQELSELIVAGSTEYIRKEALLEWAKDFKAITGWSEIEEAMDDLIDKLNSM